MDEEVDIGLTNLARRSGSFASRTPRRTPHRPSTLSISRGPVSSPLKSPSSPSLFKEFQKAGRRLSRSNTLPRIVTQPETDPNGLGNLSMEPEKVGRLRRWIHALAIVDFDLEYGPKITGIYPPLALTPPEAENIAFSSFPDGPQLEQGSQMHSFRIHLQSTPEGELDINGYDRPMSNDGFMYGFSYFTQRRDPSSKRGYQQRSLVVLTQHSYPALFYTLLSYLGQSFLMHGGPMLEVACHNIANWSDPLPGSTLELGFLGLVFTAELPSSLDTPQSSTILPTSVMEYDPDVHIPASLAPSYPPIISVFEACLPEMWTIWECLILCEPILVYGPSAAMTSQAIWWLRDILRPIPLVGDIRPFFTIHDADHGALVNPRPPQPGLLLGVTNPLIERVCKHWPHLVSLGSPIRKVPSTPRTPRTPGTPWTPVDGLSAGPAPGWKSKTHKRYISRDRTLLKKAEDALKGNERLKLELSRALRDHFIARTTAFLVPLQRYLNTLLPTPSESLVASQSHASLHLSTPSTPSSLNSASPYLGASGSRPHSTHSAHSMHSIPSTPSLPHTPSIPTTPSLPNNHLRLKPFSSKAFLNSLSASGSRTPGLLPFKSTSKQREFYEKWLRTRAFGVWIGVQDEVVKEVLEGRPSLSGTPVL